MAGVTFRPFQEECLAQLRSGRVLAAGVGAGKSIMGLGWYVTKCCRTIQSSNAIGTLWQIKQGPDLLIITTAKKRDSHEWEAELEKFALHTGKNPRTMGGVTVTIDSWNNITKYVDVEHMCVIFDEQRAIGSGAWAKAFVKIARRNPWIMLSATPADSWQDWCPVMIADGFHRNRTEFFRRHAVYSRYTKYPRVEKWIDTDYLERCRDKILITCEVPRQTERVYQQVTCGYNKVAIKDAMKTRWNPETDQPFANASELCFYIRRIINTDPTRLAYGQHIVEQHPRVIIFYTLKAELDEILKLEERTGIPVYQFNGSKHDDLPTGKRWIYAVQYFAGSEGWNCTTCDTMIFWDLPYSYKQYEQAAGRIDRLDTPYHTLQYFYLRSFAPLDISIMRALEQKKDFNVRAFVRAMKE